MSTTVSARYQRQEGILSQDLIREYPVTVVGVGAGGYAASRALAVMGTNLQLIDFDTVEEVNLGAQGWPDDTIGMKKVAAAYRELKELNPEVSIELHPVRFDATVNQQEAVVFCCVDSMAARKQVWNYCKNHCKFFVDGRMSGEVLQMYCVTGDNGGFDKYDGTLFSDSEAFQEGCTRRTTYYCAMLAASIMVSRYSKWLRGLDVPFKLEVDLMADEMWKED